MSFLFLTEHNLDTFFSWQFEAVALQKICIFGRT